MEYVPRIGEGGLRRAGGVFKLETGKGKNFFSFLIDFFFFFNFYLYKYIKKLKKRNKEREREREEGGKERKKKEICLYWK